MTANKYVIEGGTLVTVDKNNRVFEGDLHIENDRIVEISSSQYKAHDSDAIRINARDCFVMPGLVQAHVHLGQVLFRGLAEDLSLLEWLHQRIFPLEAAHSPESLSVSARLGIAELLLSGTTACLDMGTVHHTDVIFEVAREMGFRLTCGKAMMDDGFGVPNAIRESTEDSIEAASQLAEKWHGASNGLLRYAFAPRFILSCSETLMRATVEQARRLGCRLHTHASENPDEVKAVKKLTGYGNIDALHRLGFTGPDVILAHCVHLSEQEVSLLAQTGTHVAHCPSTNLKLASGIADLVRLKNAEINIGIGCDGAPCNNTLDGFFEMHLASLLQKPRYGAAAMSANDVLRMATMGGAQLLGIEHEIGSLEIGKKADVIIIDGAKAHLRPKADPATTVAHACKGSDVRDVFVNGRCVVQGGVLTDVDLQLLLTEADDQIVYLRKSAQI